MTHIDDTRNRGKSLKLEELYLMYKNELLAVANNILNHKYDAEDIVHEAFVKFFVQMNDSVDIRGNKTRGLIFIIVRHLAINLYNQRKCRYMIDIDKDVTNHSPVSGLRVAAGTYLMLALSRTA